LADAVEADADADNADDDVGDGTPHPDGVAGGQARCIELVHLHVNALQDKRDGCYTGQPEQAEGDAEIGLAEAKSKDQSEQAEGGAEIGLAEAKSKGSVRAGLSRSCR